MSGRILLGEQQSAENALFQTTRVGEGDSDKENVANRTKRHYGRRIEGRRGFLAYAVRKKDGISERPIFVVERRDRGDAQSDY